MILSALVTLRAKISSRGWLTNKQFVGEISLGIIDIHFQSAHGRADFTFWLFNYLSHDGPPFAAGVWEQTELPLLNFPTGWFSDLLKPPTKVHSRWRFERGMFVEIYFSIYMWPTPARNVWMYDQLDCRIGEADVPGPAHLDHVCLDNPMSDQKPCQVRDTGFLTNRRNNAVLKYFPL